MPDTAPDTKPATTPNSSPASSPASGASRTAPAPASPAGSVAGMDYAQAAAAVKPATPKAPPQADAKTPGKNLQVGEDLGKIKPDAATEKATSSDVTSDPLKHPYWPTFKARVATLFASVAPPDGETPEQIAADLWGRFLAAVQRSQGGMGQSAAYSNFDKGWVKMDSAAFQSVLVEFSGVCSHLAKYNASAFAQANTFGFWSKPAGRQLAEQMCDLTLETSGIGGLFDGLPSLDGSRLGWNPELWGALSRGYGQAVAAQFRQKGKKAHVCVGPGVTPGNIYDAIESKALERGALAAGKALTQVLEFHSAAVTTKKGDKLDNSKGDTYRGALYSGPDRARAIEVADAQLASLPDA